MIQIRLFALIQAVICLIGFFALLEASSLRSAASYSLGCVFVLVNVSLTAFLWSRLIQKKLIALSVTIIVFKYAILGIIIYKLLSLAWVHPLWLSVGLGSLVLSSLFYAVVAPSDEDKEEINN